MSVRRVRISGAFINLLLRDSALWASSLPDDANVIGVAGEDPRSQTFVLLIESDEFPAIAEGDLIPFIEVQFASKVRDPK
jgi:hypothetical protein